MTSVEKPIKLVEINTNGDVETSSNPHLLLTYGKQAGLFLLLVGSLGLIFTMFSLRTLLFIGMFVGGIGLLLAFQIQKMLQRGLMSYCPPGIQTLLLERSVFDILCDIWFVPNITLYVKALATPFVSRMDPEEAVHLLTDLSPSFNRAILTKGLLNLWPHDVKTAFIPEYDEGAALEQTDPRRAVLDSCQKFELFKRSIQPIPCENDPFKVLPKKTPSFGDLSIEAMSKSAENSPDIRRARSTAEIKLLEKVPDSESSRKNSSESEGKSSSSSQSEESSPTFFARLKRATTSDHSELIRSWNWDNRAAFEAFQLKLAEKKQRSPSGGNKLLNPIMGKLKSKLEVFVDRIDLSRMRKLMLLSLGLVAVQIYASRRARSWSKTFLQVLIYSSSFLITVGSIVVIQFKKYHQQTLDQGSKKKHHHHHHSK